LRSEIISIIPQEPVVFAGTVRENLDPNHDGIDDEILWKSLRNNLIKMRGTKKWSTVAINLLKEIQ